MRLNLLGLLLFLSFNANGFFDFETLTVTRETIANGGEKLCVKPFPALKSTKAECLVVEKYTGQPLTSNDPDLKFTDLSLEALGIDSKTSQGRFGAVIEWSGKGAGVLAISGPQGKLFAIGSIAPDSSNPRQLTVAIEQFSDESLSQQFDRSVLFGESDPIRLHAKTKIWLEDVLAPVIQQFLKSPEIKSVP